MKRSTWTITLKSNARVPIAGFAFSIASCPGVEFLVHRPIRWGETDGHTVTGHGWVVTERATSSSVLDLARPTRDLAIAAATDRCSKPGAAAHVLLKVNEARERSANVPISRS